MRGNLPGPEGLAGRGASAALHGLPVVPPRAAPRALHPGSVDSAAMRAARDRIWFGTRNQRFLRRRRDGGGPIQRAVAAAAIERGGDVPNLLGRGGDAVVTALAGGVDAEVIEGGRSPRDGAVAGAAILIGLNVPCRFTRSGDAVMAAHTGRGDASMIEVRRHPGECGVAVLTRVVAGDVQGALARREHAVVAAKAVGDHARMI